MRTHAQVLFLLDADALPQKLADRGSARASVAAAGLWWAPRCWLDGRLTMEIGETDLVPASSAFGSVPVSFGVSGPNGSSAVARLESASCKQERAPVLGLYTLCYMLMDCAHEHYSTPRGPKTHRQDKVSLTAVGLLDGDQLCVGEWLNARDRLVWLWIVDCWLS
eukprot:1696711-Amphidinium_carterae.1